MIHLTNVKQVMKLNEHSKEGKNLDFWIPHNIGA